MTKRADIGSKRLISLAPNAWVQWVTGNSQVRASQLLDAEFQWVSRESDVIVKASSPEHQEFLILNELQLRYDQNMPQRMRNYVALAEEKYNLSAYPVLINILPPPATVTIENCYDREFMGLKARQDYRVINLWEVDAELVLEQPLPPLFPFVPILKGGGSESKLRSAVQALRADQTLNQLEPLLAFFASFVLEIPLIQQIMRWDMTVLRESPWYQEILQEGLAQGIEQGIQQGIEQGIEQGIQQERRGSLERILKLRFSEIPVEISVRIQALTLEQLEELMATALTVNSLDEFTQHLPK
ncbi:MAG: Rpn family recombination-promoting nuclease/putative transposase [Moorea sp. SIO1G6]|uniref:DUF4351 domain-containing protein n=1 Tax=Moorena sp. SIO1G6 TaxID=2607840 RepID=UPI0013BF54E4|nr:DUF4351 domain-containing protein [Moorena sp. SIO1G6]NET64917.1 Rpn family recombination-promoting nuclease/putative transposase [Moorena sp. SIO1G6]